MSTMPDTSDRPTNMVMVPFFGPIGKPKGAMKYHRCIECNQLLVWCKECGSHHHERFWIQDHNERQKALAESLRWQRRRERDGD